jgi:hypothetical protein
MRFLFDCEDEICLPVTYKLVDEIKPFIDKVKDIEVDENDATADRKATLKKILENIMVKYPVETSTLLAKLWVLEENEKAPNAFKTMAALFSSETAIDFFTSVLPSLLSLSKSISPLLK